MSEPINDSFAKAIVSEFAKLIISGAKPIFNDLKDEIKNLLDDGLYNYLKRQTEKYAYVKTFLHRSPPKNFYELYYNLKLTFEISKNN